MIRTCPRCGEYYADPLLAFCLKDGAPLADVDRLSESWREGSRAIEEKENALRKRQRRLKWRRVLLRAMSVLIAMMIVCVLAVNALIYLRPITDEEPAPAPPSSQALTPTDPIEPITVKMGRSKPDKKSSPTPTPTPSPPPKCTAADKSRERKAIIDKYGAEWQRKIEADRQKVIAENVPRGAKNAVAAPSQLKYETTFTENCAAVSVTARYEWLITARVDGTPTSPPVSYEKRLDGRSKFRCVKSGGAWLCR